MEEARFWLGLAWAGIGGLGALRGLRDWHGPGKADVRFWGANFIAGLSIVLRGVFPSAAPAILIGGVVLLLALVFGLRPSVNAGSGASMPPNAAPPWLYPAVVGMDALIGVIVGVMMGSLVAGLVGAVVVHLLSIPFLKLHKMSTRRANR